MLIILVLAMVITLNLNDIIFMLIKYMWAFLAIFLMPLLIIKTLNLKLDFKVYLVMVMSAFVYFMYQFNLDIFNNFHSFLATCLIQLSVLLIFEKALGFKVQKLERSFDFKNNQSIEEQVLSQLISKNFHFRKEKSDREFIKISLPDFLKLDLKSLKLKFPEINFDELYSMIDNLKLELDEELEQKLSKHLKAQESYLQNKFFQYMNDKDEFVIENVILDSKYNDKLDK